MLVVEVLHETEGETRQIVLVPERAIIGFALLVELHRVLEEGDEVHRRTKPLLVLRRVHVRELQSLEELVVQLLQEGGQARYGLAAGVRDLWRRGPLFLVLVLLVLLGILLLGLRVV